MNVEKPRGCRSRNPLYLRSFMKTSRFPLAEFIKLALATWLCLLTAAQSASITVEVDKPGIAVSPRLYGIFFEEINRSGDGGIYAEMIQNRSFEDAPVPNAWTLVKSGKAEGTMALDRSQAINAKNPTALKLQIGSAGGRVGIANEGFKGARWNRQWVESTQHSQTQIDEFAAAFAKAAKDSSSGIAVEKAKTYRLSLYARVSDGFSGPLNVTIEKQDGQVLASQKIEGLRAQWKKQSLLLTASETDTNARLVLSASTPGSVYLDMVSLFPTETFKGRENGIRKDLGQMLADMKPAFVRFPGGCFVEGNIMANAHRWKDTIGDIAERPGHHGYWGYYSTGGLGQYEYLQFCEDIGAEPLFVINCGMSHCEVVPLAKLGEYVQDALDLIEYANGPVESKWGSLRAKAGHPAPFNLKMIQIGNENGGTLYDERYARFYDAIKAKYPEVKIVANNWGGIPKSRPIEILDEHYYKTPEFFMRQADRYDSYERGKYKIYCGEYAVTNGSGMGNQIAAVGEAAFMTGLERNADVVEMASYAPLLVHPDWRSWNPNAIVFDNSRIYGTPSYYVQALFANHRADRVLPLKVEAPENPPPAVKGMIGLGTFNTQAEFKEIQVRRGGEVLYSWDPQQGLKGWKEVEGQWSVRDGAICQSGTGEKVRLALDQLFTTDYTLSLKARRTGGSEGFLICFQNREPIQRTFWNIGGWNNRRHALQGPDMPAISEGVDGSIETGRWYDIRIEIKASGVACYLDGKLIQSFEYKKIQSLYATAGLSADAKELILKVVNVSPQPLATSLVLNGAKQLQNTAKAWVMSGKDSDENSFQEPTKISPKPESVSGVSSSFTHSFPAKSVTVLRLQTKP